VYVLDILFGTDRCEFRQREEGMARALVLGDRQRVRVWLTDEECGFALVEDFRTDHPSDTSEIATGDPSTVARSAATSADARAPQFYRWVLGWARRGSP
jgi:hypothetical protein